MAGEHDIAPRRGFPAMLNELIPETLLPMLRLAASLAGAGAALLMFSLLVWTWRDINVRSRDEMVRIGSIILSLLLPLFGTLIYMLLRPRDTIAERYEREMIEELLAREISAGSIARRATPAAGVPPAGARPAGGAS
jgi:hypothetical protein